MSISRVDANQAEIVAALRAAGAECQSLAGVRDGCPDVLCAFRGAWHVLEIKTKRGKLTPREVAWHERFNRCAPVHIVRSVDEALRAVGAVKEKEPQNGQILQ